MTTHEARADAGDVSWHHQVHELVSAVVFLALVAAQLVLARAFGRDSRWHDLRPYSIVSGLLTLVLLVLFGTGAIEGWNGLVQRIFIAVPWIWIAVLGLRLRRIAGSPASMPTPFG
jgi:O-antigen ligase